MGLMLLLSILYGIFLLTCLVVALFIIYHISNYSFGQTHPALTLLVFTAVFAALFFTNIILFLMIPFDDMLSSLPI